MSSWKEHRIGFSTHCFTSYPPIEMVIDWCLKNEFNAMELNVNRTNFNYELLNHSTLRLLQRINQSGKVRLSMHAPTDMNFAAQEPEIRRDTIERTIQAIRLAADIGIEIIVLHPGQHALNISDMEHENALNRSISGIQECAIYAGDLGVNVSVENLCHVPGTVAPDIDSFMDMCEKIGLDLVGITLDTGHSFIDGLEHTVSVVREYVNHIHIDDNSGSKSEHLELGRGKLPFYSIAKFLREFRKGNINIELKPKLESKDFTKNGLPVLRSRAYLQALFEGQISYASNTV